MYPTHRMRRLRTTEAHRRLAKETRLGVDSLVLPLLAIPGSGKRQTVPWLPGAHGHSVDLIGDEVKAAADLGIGAVFLVGEPEAKDSEGSESYSPAGVVQRAIRAIKRAVPEMLVITDVCMCRYTDHGHCGIFEADQVHNDETLEVLQQIALSHARCGADIVAPSAMMDGQVLAIRQALEEDHLGDVGIMAFSAHYASTFAEVGTPGASPLAADRRTYQMDPSNVMEALREAAMDIEEGADIVAVKPAGAHLDVVYRVKEAFGIPVAAYHSEGESAAILAGAEKGWIDQRAAVLESLTGMVRAGADLVVTHFARDVAQWLCVK